MKFPFTIILTFFFSQYLFGQTSSDVNFYALVGMTNSNVKVVDNPDDAAFEDPEGSSGITIDLGLIFGSTDESGVEWGLGIQYTQKGASETRDSYEVDWSINYINLGPRVGYRFNFGKLDIAVIGRPHFGILTNHPEGFKVSPENNSTTDLNTVFLHQSGTRFETGYSLTPTMRFKMSDALKLTIAYEYQSGKIGANSTRAAYKNKSSTFKIGVVFMK